MPPPTQSTLGQLIRDALDRLRTKLLDLSGRNRLLNFKFSDRSKRFVRIVDEVPDQLYSRLTDDSGSSRKMYVVGLPDPPEVPADEAQAVLGLEVAVGGLEESPDEAGSPSDSTSRRQQISPAGWARVRGIDPSFELPRVNDGRATHGDDQIQTLLFDKDLIKKLAAIREDDQLTQQEIGLGTLHVALGFLEWYESDASQEIRWAPLILLPVQMDRELLRGRYRYFIECGEGSDALVNITLRERLRRDFGLFLPDLNEEDTTEAYFTRVERLLGPHPRWKVRRMAVIGHFSFTRLAMYEDLSAEAWLRAPLEANPLIAGLLGGTATTEQLADDDVDPDSEDAERQVHVVITDADSSQFSAILDAMQGRSFALKGPPGTGKSQTITNLIAAALAKNKQVLFVAEKMAALNVVSDRLRAAGLGPFVLELHSTKSQKKQVLDSFAQRLGIRYANNDHTLDHSLRQLREVRSELKDYVERMNSQLGETGYTPHEIFWEEQAARRHLSEDLRTSMTAIRDEAATTVGRESLVARSTLLEEFATYWAKCLEQTGRLSSHPLYGVNDISCEAREPGTLKSSFSALETSSETLRCALVELCQRYEISTDQSLGSCRGISEALSSVPSPIGAIDAALLPRLRSAANLTTARQLIDGWAAFLTARDALAPWVDQPDAILQANDRIGNYVEKLDDATGRLGVDRAFEDYAALRRSVDVVARVLDIGQRFSAIAGNTAPLNVKALVAFLRATHLLHSVPPSALSYRNSQLQSSDADQVVARLAQESNSIRDSLRLLGSQVNTERLASADVLRTHGDVLKRKNALTGFFSANYRGADRYLKSIATGQHKLTRLEGADVLERAADLLNRRESFDKNAELLEIAGRNAKGIGTNFAALRAAVEYLKRVRTQFSTFHDEERVLRKTLESTDEATLLEVPRAVGIDDAKVVLEWAKRFASSTKTVRELVSEHVGLCDAAQTAREHIVRLGVRPDALGNLTALAAISDDAKKSLASIQAHGGLAFFGADYAPEQKHQLNRAIATVDLAASIRRSALSVATQNCLLSEDFEQVRNEVVLAGQALRNNLNALNEQTERTSSRFRIEFEGWVGGPRAKVTCAKLAERAAAVVALQEAAINEWDRFSQLRTEVVAIAGVPLIVDLLETSKIVPSQVTACYRYVFFRSLIATLHKTCPRLKDWTGERMSNLRSKLARLDREYAEVSQTWLASSLSRRPVPAGIASGVARERTDRALLEHEIGKQRRHLPIRKLLERAGNAARALKPCFMMSPASVAQFLSTSQDSFDLLIVDEASQMRPEEAIGALARARQAIVVGDPLQLPPTSFFDAGHEEVSDTDEDDQVDIDTESILDLALSNWRPHRELRWHYRSRHHSLIAFSNRQFYGDRLIVFPSPASQSSELGIELVGVADGVYRNHVNDIEAKKVVESVLQLTRLKPEKSIGVVAMNQPQRDLLNEMFDRAFAEDPMLEDYRQRWSSTLEPFFVKNLENVQGDERDRIVISTVYGPTQPGGPVAQRFGPINNKIGHRRLNVLLTRAKEKVLVVSTLSSEQILIQPASSMGVIALKRYLEYARSGRLDGGEESGSGFDSPFEAEVAETIVELGYEVAAQVGVAGYFIDLAVRQPGRIDHFALGIECDGATYHSARSARDRDRLRQEVLERLGWSLHRIWSTDWFANRQREVTRLRQRIESAI